MTSIVTSRIITPNWKFNQAWINKYRYIHTPERYPPIKRKTLMMNARSVGLRCVLWSQKLILKSCAVYAPIYTIFWERQSYREDKNSRIGIRFRTWFLGGTQTTTSPFPRPHYTALPLPRDRHALCAQSQLLPQLCADLHCSLARAGPGFADIFSTEILSPVHSTSAPSIRDERADRVLRLSVRWRATFFQEFLDPSAATVAAL